MCISNFEQNTIGYLVVYSSGARYAIIIFISFVLFYFILTLNMDVAEKYATFGFTQGRVCYYY